MKKGILFFLIFMTAVSCFAATGRIFGIVTSSKTGEPLQMAAAKVAELKTGSFTDKSGKFMIADVPAGTYTVQIELIGFVAQEQTVVVKSGETAKADFELKVQAVNIGGSSVSANRAIKRETPIAFTNIDQDEISDKYTTEDMPQLLDDVPGLFSSTTGMGDAEITMRGFEADKIQVLINGIPVNDPESQKVYWSNWTGLTSNVKSVQVQKGAGSSLYGSGAFGGSLNIETMGATQHSETVIRASYAGYTTEGDVANGEGQIESYYPFNYNIIGRYNSGALYGGKFNYSIMAERKYGDYYIEGTNYRGWSFGFDTQTVLAGHKISTSLLGAPQEHNQVYFKSDRTLMETLGREYNRNNHEYQENYYFKPQFSIRDEWEIDDKSLLMTNFFVTKGDGGGKYISQDKFDVNTGEVAFNDGFLDKVDPYAYENLEFGKHALWLYKNYGVISEGFNPADTVWVGPFPIETPTYNGVQVDGNGQDFFSSPSRYDYSWRNNNISDHFQFGLNTYFDHKLNESVNMVFGGELRKWEGNHYNKIEMFRTYSAEDTLTHVETFENFERGYDYTTHVLNMSAFARFKIKPMENLNFMLDGQIARYASEVEENPIEIYDLGTGEPTGIFRYDTKEVTEVVDGDTLLKFEDDDYEKVYSFFSPKVGVNYNLSEYFNVRSNYSIAYKEPKTSQWYGYDGPDTRQLYTKNVVLYDENGNPYDNVDEEHFYGELNPEKINTLEFGIGYDGINFDIDANYYISDYEDKIESVNVPIKEDYYNVQADSIEVNEFDAGLVINAGKARHQGLELSINGDLGAVDAAASMTLAHNRWTEMNVEEIFGMSAEEMKDKVVPYSPEIMANFNIGYTFNELPRDAKFRVGLTGKYWDGYYANYENEYYANYVWDENAGNDGDYVAEENSLTSSELPYFLEFGADMKYSFQLGGKDAFVKIGFNNILNRDNLSSARVASDYNRGYFDENGDFQDDYLNSNPTMYVTPSPLFNMYMTTEVKF